MVKISCSLALNLKLDFVRDFEVLKFGQYFELMFGKDFEVALVKILKLEALSGF